MHSMRYPLLALLAALNLCGCGMLNLAHVPRDLVDRGRSSAPTTRNTQLDTVEAALYAAVDDDGRDFLISDTQNLRDDPKYWARRCDEGETADCARVASLLMYPLGQDALALDLWGRSCDAGDGRSCTRAADAYARTFRPYHDAKRAYALFVHGCEATPGVRRACMQAALRAGRPDLSFLFLDRACEHGLETACNHLSAGYHLHGSRGRYSVWDPILMEYYAQIVPRTYHPHEQAPVTKQETASLGDLDWSKFEGIEPRKTTYLAKRREPLMKDRLFWALNPLEWTERTIEKVEADSRTFGIPCRHSSACAGPGGRPLTVTEISKFVAAGNRWTHRSVWRDVPAKPWTVCHDCLDACPDPLPDDPEAQVCFCTCLREKSDCGLRREALNACIAERSAQAGVKP